MRIVAFILLFRSLTRYHSVITPILSNTFLIVWQGGDNAVNPSCDSVTTRQRISKTLYIVYIAYNIYKNRCLVVSLSHNQVAKRTLNDHHPPLIHRLSTRRTPPNLPPKGRDESTRLSGKALHPLRGGMNLPDYRAKPFTP